MPHPQWCPRPGCMGPPGQLGLELDLASGNLAHSGGVWNVMIFHVPSNPSHSKIHSMISDGE